MSVRAKLKFVTFYNGAGAEEIIVFPAVIQHLAFAESVTELSFGRLRAVSGGFVMDGECVGESVSLGMKAREEDTELLKKLLEV